MINWFNMPTEGLSNGGLFEIKELTATENKVYQKDGEVYNKVTVNVEGGGGGDFSTAEVTIVNDIGHSTEITQCVTYYEAGSLGEGSPACVTNFAMLNNGSNTFNVVLYKGCVVWFCPFDEDVTITTSGDVTEDDGSLYITGDCTIYISSDSTIS